jgi:hypothetical protein
MEPGDMVLQQQMKKTQQRKSRAIARQCSVLYRVHANNLMGSYSRYDILLKMFQTDLFHVGIDLPATCFHTGFSSYSLTITMEAICSSEISLHFQQITWHYTPENSAPQTPSSQQFGDSWTGNCLHLLTEQEM